MNVIVDDTSPFGTYAPNRLQRRLHRGMARLYGHGWIGKRILGRLRWLDRKMASSEIVDVDRFGQRWRLYRSGNASDIRLLIRPDSFDPVEMGLLIPRVQPEFAFVDVGANCGFYAIRVAGAGGRVVAIEPHPGMFRRLQFNAGLNSESTVRLLQCAVGDRVGDVGMSEGSRNLGETRIDADGTIAVRIRPLLDILADVGLDRLDALKVDVEGYEDRVLVPFLKDAPESLLPQTIFAEHIWSDHWVDDWQQTADVRGYHEYARTPTGNIVMIRGRK